MIKWVALLLALLIAYAGFAVRQEKSATVIHCGVVSGGGWKAVADGTKAAEWLGDLIAEAKNGPASADEMAATFVDIIETTLVKYWFGTFLNAARDERLDPGVFRVREQAAREQQMADDACTPCPTALPQGSSPLASLGNVAPAGSKEDVVRAAAARVWPASEVDTAVAVAGAESTYNPAAINSLPALGLWQINAREHRDLVSGKDWKDPNVNAQMAFQVWKDAGNSWWPWDTYKHGTYRKFLKHTATAATSLSNSASPTTPASSSIKDAILAKAAEMGGQTDPKGHLDPQGLSAFDIMSTGATNTAIAEEMRSNHAVYGLRYVISQNRIASPNSSPAWAWRPYNRPAAGDARHVNHVHVSYTDGPSVAASTGPQVADSPRVGCSSEGMPGAAFASWNTFHGGIYPDPAHVNDGRVVNAMKEIAGVADVIGTQELSDSARKRKVIDALTDFSVVGDNTSHPIFFRKTKFTLVDSSTEQVYERGDNIDGPDQGTRYVVSATLRDNASGKVVTVVNMHQLPHIQSHGLLDKHYPKRVDMARKYWAVAMTAVRTAQSRGAVVVTGDMNYDGDPEGMYAAAGLTMASKVFGTVNTRKKREIDQIMWTAGAPTSEKLLGHFGSDHQARMVTFPESPTSTPSAPVDGISPASFNFAGQNTVDQAIAYMSNGHKVRPGTCLHEVGAAYGLNGTTPVAGHFYATGQWDAMPSKYKTTDGSTPPRGALVFWKTGNVAGHIAISAGGNYVWTTDPPGHPGTIAKVPISVIDGWGTRLGYGAPFFVGKTGAAAA